MMGFWVFSLLFCEGSQGDGYSTNDGNKEAWRESQGKGSVDHESGKRHRRAIL